jgi:tetratricopeptide (TPR) repeat protein
VIGKPPLLACIVIAAAIATTGCSRQINQMKCASTDPDARITGCTALLQSNQDSNPHRAVIFNNRGTAYQAKGDNDRAIPDFNEAIRLSPTYADAYRERSVSYYAREITIMPFRTSTNSAPSLLRLLHRANTAAALR